MTPFWVWTVGADVVCCVSLSRYERVWVWESRIFYTSLSLCFLLFLTVCIFFPPLRVFLSCLAVRSLSPSCSLEFLFTLIHIHFDNNIYTANQLSMPCALYGSLAGVRAWLYSVLYYKTTSARNTPIHAYTCWIKLMTKNNTSVNPVISIHWQHLRYHCTHKHTYTRNTRTYQGGKHVPNRRTKWYQKERLLGILRELSNTANINTKLWHKKWKQIDIKWTVFGFIPTTSKIAVSVHTTKYCTSIPHIRYTVPPSDGTHTNKLRAYARYSICQCMCVRMHGSGSMVSLSCSWWMRVYMFVSLVRFFLRLLVRWSTLLLCVYVFPWPGICICDGCEHAQVYVRNQI